MALDRKELKDKAKKSFTPHLGAILLVLLIVLVVYGLLAVMSGVGAIVSFIIAGSISLSFASIFLNVLKGKKPVAKDLIFGFQDENLLRGLFAFLRYEIFTFLWTLLLIVPGIIKSISYSQMFYLMAENPKMTAGEAQAKSMKIMEGHKWDYFILQLSFIPWHLLSIVTFGIAEIYVTPYVSITNAASYKKINK